MPEPQDDEAPREYKSIDSGVVTGFRWPDPEAGPWFVSGSWIEIDGRPECVGLHLYKGVTPVAGRQAYQPIDPTTPLEGIAGVDLKQFPVATLIARLWERERINQLLDWHNVADLVDALEAGTPAGAEKWRESPQLTSYLTGPGPFEEQKPKRRKVDDTEWFAEVARVYTDAYLNRSHASTTGQRSPTKEVARHFTVAYSTATKWVAKARDLGLLEKTSKGRPSGAPTTKGK